MREKHPKSLQTALPSWRQLQSRPPIGHCSPPRHEPNSTGLISISCRTKENRTLKIPIPGTSKANSCISTIGLRHKYKSCCLCYCVHVGKISEPSEEDRQLVGLTLSRLWWCIRPPLVVHFSTIACNIYYEHASIWFVGNYRSLGINLINLGSLSNDL